MVHGLDAVAIRLGGDVAVLDVDLHPLVGGLLRLLLQYLPAQYLPVLGADGRNSLEAFVLEQVSKSDCLEMSLDMRDPLIGVLEPDAVLGSHRNVAYGGEAAPGGSSGEPLRVSASELQVHQTAVSDVVVVRRSQRLDDARLNPLPSPALVAHSECPDDAAHRSLAGVPASGVDRRIDRAFPVGLSLHVEHPACLGRDKSLVPFYPAKRALLPEARDGAVDQTRVEFREVVIRQSPFGHVSGTKRLHQHVGLTCESDGLLTPLLGVARSRTMPFLPRFHEIQAG